MIGIRHEDKSRWERRAPLVPADVGALISEHGLRFAVQRSPTRAFPDEDYRAAGAEIVDDLRDCAIILGVKEIPPACFEPGRTYVFFSHTIKAQSYNMPMLRRIIELGCQLIDYELITDAQGRRLVFFGPFAGRAGMIDALWALGQRLRHEGVENPFELVRQAYQYANLAEARQALAAVGAQIREHGLPRALRPLVCGFAGYGNVSAGAQEIFDLLGVQEVRPEELADLPAAARECFKVVFREEHMVERIADAPAAPAGFDLREYYQHPERYRPVFFAYVPHLTILANCIYWDPRYPRFVTCAQLRELFSGPTPPRLRVIADITCDINGSIECNVRATEPDDPVYVYEPASGQVRSGVVGAGPVVLAVDHLPCELPVDASEYFSRALRPLIPPLARADFGGSLEHSGLPPELQRATMVYQGKLTERYRYLEAHLH